MNELKIFERTNKAVVSSRIIAEKFNKRHGDILSKLEGKNRNANGRNKEIGLIEQIGSTGNPVGSFFIKSQYADSSNGEVYNEYLCTRDGFSLLVMGFTGENAVEWKIKYINAFNQMESALRERQSTEWLQTRKNGKLIRRNETDAIQQLIPYTEEQGSKNAKMFYTNYSKLVNKNVGLETGERDIASHKQLMMVGLLEDMISNTILEEMQRNVYYKTIYQICKDKTEQFSRLIGNKCILNVSVNEKELVLF